MADEKKEVPKHIKEFYDRTQSIENIINGTKNAHSAAYTTAASILVSEGSKNPDYSRLEDAGVREQFIDKLIDSYLTFATQQSGIEKPKTDFEKDILLQKYVGVTRSELSKRVHKAKSGYTIDNHEKIRDALVKKQSEELAPLASGHLKKEHIDDILAHTGTSKYFNKDVLEIEKAAALLNIYKGAGEITLSTVAQLKDQFGGDAYLTADTVKAVKDLKDKYKQAA